MEPLTPWPRKSGRLMTFTSFMAWTLFQLLRPAFGFPQNHPISRGCIGNDKSLHEQVADTRLYGTLVVVLRSPCPLAWLAPRR